MIKGDLTSASQRYQKAIDLATAISDTTYIARGYVCLGLVADDLENWDNAEKYYKKGIALSESIGQHRDVGIIYNFLGTLYTDTGAYDKAIDFLTQSKAIMQELGIESRVHGANRKIATVYKLQNQPTQGISYAFANLAYQKNKKDTIFMAYAHLLLGSLYQGMGQYEKSLAYLDSTLYLTTIKGANNVAYDALLEKAMTFEKKGDYENALATFKLFQKTKEDFIGGKVQKDIAKLEVKLETEEKAKALLTKESEVAGLQIQRQRLWLLVGGLMASLVIGLLFFYKKRGENQKRQELEATKAQLLKTQLKNQALETQQLQGKLATKDADLTNLALDIVRKNEFSKQLVEKLEVLQKGKPDAMKAGIRELLGFTNSHTQLNEDLALLQQNINTVNQEFYHKLESRFGAMTANEKYLAGLIRLNLSNKEIANLRGISASSAKMNRHRLRKKFGLAPQVDFVQFLQEV